MPFPNQVPRPFTREQVEALRPGQPGVYGFFQQQQNGRAWVYVGESDDIRRRLLEHLNGDNPCINRYWPTHWVDQVVQGGRDVRRAREKVLIAEYNPACNVA